jgi:hypothetical protein
MSSDQAVLPGGSPANAQPPKPSGSWLGSQSVFDTRDERKLGRAMGVSMMIHGGVLALIMLALTVAPQQSAQLLQDLKVVFLSEAGPGGGGGGSPAPAPAKPSLFPIRLSLIMSTTPNFLKRISRSGSCTATERAARARAPKVPAA